MDGHELTRRLRTAEATHNRTQAPIIAVTADAMTGEEERCLATGMDAYLVKPVSIERLRSTLERWLPTESENNAACSGDQTKSATVIDRDLLAGWLADDRDAVDEISNKLRQTAIQAEREIDDASRAGNLATWRQRHTNSVEPRWRSVRPALPQPSRSWSRREKPGTQTVATCLGRSRYNHATPSRRSRDLVGPSDLFPH